MLLELFSNTFKDIWQGVAESRAPDPWTQLCFALLLLFSTSCSPGQTSAWVYQLLPKNYLILSQPSKITCWGHFSLSHGSDTGPMLRNPRKGARKWKILGEVYHAEISPQNAWFCWFQKGLDGSKQNFFLPSQTGRVKGKVSGRICLHGSSGR